MVTLELLIVTVWASLLFCAWSLYSKHVSPSQLADAPLSDFTGLHCDHDALVPSYTSGVASIYAVNLCT